MRQHIGQRRDRTDSGLGLKKQRHFVSLSFGFDRLIQRLDLLVEHRHQLEQVVSPTSCPRLQRQFAQDLLSGCTPQLRSEEHTSELQSQSNLVCRLLLEKKKAQQADNLA